MSLGRTLFSVFCLTVCIFSMISLAAVLSFPDFERAGRPVYKSYCDQSWDLAFDICLIFSALFVHYILNCMDLFADYTTSTQRCLYSIITAFITQIVLFNWRRTSLFNLWNVSEVSDAARYLIIIVHLMAYLQLIANSVFDEAIEAFGFSKWSTTTSEHSSFETSSYFNKSQELARLEGRLPASGGLTLLTVLFLMYPTMPLERALAALALVSYNFCTSTLEEQDYFYVRRHFFKKVSELLYFDQQAAGRSTSDSPLLSTSISNSALDGKTNFPISRSSSQDSFYYEERNATVRNRAVTNMEVRRSAGRTEVTRSTRSSRKL